LKVNVSEAPIQSSEADTVIVNLFSGVTSPGGATGAMNDALGGAISELISQGDFKGKAGEVAVLYPRGAVKATRVLVVGLGEQEKFTAETVRRAAGKAAVRARELGAKHIATIAHGAGIGGLEAAAAAEATTEGMLLALYRYDAPKKRELPAQPEQITLVEADAGKLDAIRAGADKAVGLASGVTLARDLVNLPPNVATPGYLADTARQIAADHGLEITVGDRAWARERNMGAFLAVSEGTAREPAFIVMEYNPEGSSEAPIVLVGKGITFDTGGISLKPSAGMWDMKSDMGGAAAVLGAMKAITELKLERRVVVIAACAENMPDGAAFRPADVLTASNGKTIEVLSTDAEGRLVLADALVYAQQYRPSAVIDLATLTGACVVALGDAASGLFSNDDALRQQLVDAGNATHERAWPMPLFEEYRKQIDSEVADLKNTGGRGAGAATAAAFLQEFTDYPWAHLDIASMALSEKPADYTPKGGTGYGVRLLVEYVLNAAKNA
jgi:leucyl aminopeptidase